MASTATTMDASGALGFATSESKSVGVLSPIRELIPETVRKLAAKERQFEYDNAARIVGGLKLTGDIAVSFVSPTLLAYSIFSITGRLIMMTWGSKSHQKQLAKEKAEGKHQNLLGHSFMENDRKILYPRKYPIESSAGFSVIGETVAIGYGIQRFMEYLAQKSAVLESAKEAGLTGDALHKAVEEGVTAGTGYTSILLGLLAVYSYGTIVFSKEKKTEDQEKEEKEKGQPLTFAKSQSKAVGLFGRLRNAMKGNPVLVSSLINTGISAGMLIGGIVEGYAFAWLAAASIFIFANAMQAVLVRKNEYNIEGATTKQAVEKMAEEKQVQGADKHATSFQERLAEQRGRGNDLGLQST